MIIIMIRINTLVILFYFIVAITNVQYERNKNFIKTLSEMKKIKNVCLLYLVSFQQNVQIYSYKTKD
jgi:hypothetical protein